MPSMTGVSRPSSVQLIIWFVRRLAISSLPLRSKPMPAGVASPVTCTMHAVRREAVNFVTEIGRDIDRVIMAERQSRWTGKPVRKNGATAIRRDPGDAACAPFRVIKVTIRSEGDSDR